MALIRKEVAEHRATQHYGEVVLTVERSNLTILMVALGFIGLVVVLASSFSYTSRVRAPGVFMPLDDAGNARAEAVLLVPPKEMERVRIGQTVTLRLAGYAPEAGGRMEGTVSQVAGFSERLESHQPSSSVTVVIGPAGFKTVSPNVQLHKGMKLDASINIERHRLIAWAFRPMLSVFDRID